MLAELLELCLEPKRINELQNLEHLFPDFLDERQPQTYLHNDEQNSNENHQQAQAQLPLPIPMPEIFSQQVQQLNLNSDYQQDSNSLALNYNDNQSNRAINSSNRNSNELSGNNSQLIEHNQSNTNRKVLKRNSSSSSYASKNYYRTQSPNSTKNEPSINSHVNNQTKQSISKKITDNFNWQSKMNSVKERNSVLFNNDYMSDLNLLVGSCEGYNDKSVVKIPVHKHVLGSGSAVFYAMLYGDLAEKNTKTISLPDDDPSGILNLLRFLYSDDICLEPDNVIATFSASKKYIVPILSRACIYYLEQILTAHNACILLSQTRLYDEQEFIDQCYEVIDAQSETAFKSSSFLDIDEGTLELILKRETLHNNSKENIEMIIFEAVYKWSEKECIRRDLEVNSKNRRKVLGDKLYLIRMPTISLTDFANGPALYGLLEPEETTSLFIYYTAKNQPNFIESSINKFNLKKRRGLDLYSIKRFQTSAYRENQWKYRGRCDSISFSVDKKIFIIGYGLYSSNRPDSIFKVKMELKRNDKVLAQKSDLSLVGDGTSRSFKFMFDRAIEIYPNHLYTASVTLDGSSCSFFGQDGLKEVTFKKDDTIVTFNFQCSSDSTNGTGVSGGQLPELLFYIPSLDNKLLNKSAESSVDSIDSK